MAYMEGSYLVQFYGDEPNEHNPVIPCVRLERRAAVGGDGPNNETRPKPLNK
jgi:hypothetical protein